MIIAANISLIRVFGKDDDNVNIPTVLKGFVEKQEKDEVIDEFFKEEYEPSTNTVAVKKKLVDEETILDYGGLNGKTEIVHDAGNLGITESQQDESTVSFHNISDVGIAENLEIREIPVEKLVEKEIIIGNTIHDAAVRTQKKRKTKRAKKKIVNPDKFSSASLQRPDGTTLELKRNPDGVGKAQGSIVDGTDPGILTKRDRIQREISKETGQKRLDPWSGNKRWQKARYDENNEDPTKE
jgi:hypothetical protein